MHTASGLTLTKEPETTPPPLARSHKNTDPRIKNHHFPVCFLIPARRSPTRLTYFFLPALVLVFFGPGRASAYQPRGSAVPPEATRRAIPPRAGDRTMPEVIELPQDQQAPQDRAPDAPDGDACSLKSKSVLDKFDEIIEECKLPEKRGQDQDGQDGGNGVLSPTQADEVNGNETATNGENKVAEETAIVHENGNGHTDDTPQEITAVEETTTVEEVQPPVSVSVSEPSPIEEPSPVDEPAPVEEPTPVVEATPVEEPSPVEQPSPVEEPAPIEDEPAPVEPVPVAAPRIAEPEEEVAPVVSQVDSPAVEDELRDTSVKKLRQDWDKRASGQSTDKQNNGPRKVTMATSIDTQSVRAAYDDVRSDGSKTEWAVFKFQGSKIKGSAKGSEFAEFKDQFIENERCFGYIRIQTGDEMSKRQKFLFVTWVGPEVSVLQRAKMSTDKSVIKTVITNFAVELQLENLNEIDLNKFVEELNKAGGANYGTGVRADN